MKADPAVQRRLLDLADIDAELNRLAHRRRTLPEHTELAAAETAVRAAKDALVEVETAGRRPRPRHPAARTRRRGRPRPRRPRQQAPRGLRGRRRAGDRPAARARDPRPPAGRAGGRGAGGHGAARGRRHGRPARPAHSATRRRSARRASRSAATRRWPTSTRPRPGVAATARRSSWTSPPTCSCVYDKRREPRRRRAPPPLLQRRCQACRLELDRTALAALQGGTGGRGRVLRGVRSAGAHAPVGPLEDRGGRRGCAATRAGRRRGWVPVTDDHDPEVTVARPPEVADAPTPEARTPSPRVQRPGPARSGRRPACSCCVTARPRCRSSTATPGSATPS